MMQTKLSTAHLDSRNDGTVLQNPSHPIPYRIASYHLRSSLLQPGHPLGAVCRPCMSTIPICLMVSSNAAVGGSFGRCCKRAQPNTPSRTRQHKACVSVSLAHCS